jgi:uncharacterized protein (UPF0332 family)
MNMDWQGFLNKAQSNLRVAERAYADNEPDASVSRAYYAVFHAALAALLKLTDYRRKGQSWDHGNVSAEFSRRLIMHRKVFSGDLARIPADLRMYRHKADYNSDTIGEKTAGQVLKLAQEFVLAVINRLGEKNERQDKEKR